jgi:hypothetical protein
MRPDGGRACRACRSEASLRWQQAHPEYHREQARKRRAAQKKLRRYPIQPLLDYLGTVVIHSADKSQRATIQPYPNNDLAELVGLSIREVCRWKTAGYIREDYADRIACTIGVHPSLIWKEWFAA